ncbi:MAG: hypothetical protein HY583_04455 [Candidatus Omnitrophica bacterium]|nr:hypothetical protein [Candidatus Omnitrophota bacterium]
MRKRIFLVPIFSVYFTMLPSVFSAYTYDTSRDFERQIRDQTYVVSRALSGHEVELKGGKIIQLNGVRAPDGRFPEQLDTESKLLEIDPDWYKSYAEKSRRYLEDLLRGKEVALEFDSDYNYLFLPPPGRNRLGDELIDENGNEYMDHPGIVYDERTGFLFVNAMLIRNGYANVSVENRIEFARLRNEARAAGRGIWLMHRGNSFLRSDGTIWVERQGIQCEDRILSTSYRDYFSRRNIEIHETLETEATGEVFCQACGCPTGEVILFRINAENLDFFVNAGFEPTRSPYISDSPKWERLEKEAVTVSKEDEKVTVPKEDLTVRR